MNYKNTAVGVVIVVAMVLVFGYFQKVNVTEYNSSSDQNLNSSSEQNLNTIQRDIEILNEDGFSGLCQKYDISKFDHEEIRGSDDNSFRGEMFTFAAEEAKLGCNIVVRENRDLMVTFGTSWYIEENSISLDQLNSYVLEMISDSQPISNSEYPDSDWLTYSINSDDVEFMLSVNQSSPDSEPEFSYFSLSYAPSKKDD